MFKTLRGRLIAIAVIIGVAGWQLYSHKTETGEWLKLGLDLQGGMHLVLEVDDPDSTMTADAKSDMIDRVDRIIRTRIDQFGVEEPLIQKVGGDRLIVELAGIDDEDRAKGIIQESAFLEFNLVLPTAEFDQALSRIDRSIVATLGVDSIRALGRDVVDESDDLENLLFGADSAATPDSAAADTTAAPEEDEAESIEDALRPFSSLLFTGDVEGTYFVAAEDRPVAEQFLAMDEVQRAYPRDQKLRWGADLVAQGARNYYRLYVLEEDAFLTGEELEDATAQRDPQFNQSQVQFQLSRAGGRQFARFSGSNVGNYLAIVLDNEVMSAPVIRDRIGARGQIEMGQGTPLEEARDLALVLRAGALPVRINIVEERTVGPSLGQDSIDQGTVAGMVGIAMVVVIMIVYYGMAGLLAVGALGVYVLLVLGGLAGLNATLTVPGIAGLILSIGMAVDANVLIFERIREELDHGRATRTAVDEGFEHALSAIVDANITTLITALILFQFGTGPVRGFAVTLSIGIVASFFSALFVTRSFFLAYLSGKKASDPISI
ncbi:MAG: protein translocase subunit SecD [Gemmatimonadetes bacterium]|nr:protein translocase subunit SecD [Gemmatimonadota bacterium]NNF13637.1 protein translocase subunit SecD [Gemmatimonadota bacterium]